MVTWLIEYAGTIAAPLVYVLPPVAMAFNLPDCRKVGK